MGWTFRVRIREGAREFFLSLNFQASKPPILWILGSFPGPWCWHSLPSDIVDKNEWSCTSAPSMCYVVRKGTTLIHFIGIIPCSAVIQLLLLCLSGTAIPALSSKVIRFLELLVSILKDPYSNFCEHTHLFPVTFFVVFLSHSRQMSGRVS